MKTPLPAGCRGTLIVLMIVLLSGCSRRVIHTVTQVKDSVIVREVTKVIPLTVAKDSVVIRLDKEARGVFEKKSKRASLRVKVDSHGLIQATANCDSVQQLLSVKVNEIERLHTERVREEKETIVYRTRGIDKFCRWLTAAVVAGAVLYLIGKKFGIR